MVTTLTREQVQSMAPDSSSIKSGLSLANGNQWLSLGANDDVLWGECKGSGKNPYQTQVDLATFTTRCSCPSRKFPCKHALGLMVLYADQIPQLNTPSTAPQWVNEWMEGRKARAIKKEEKANNPKPIDPQKQAANAEKKQKARWERIESGAQELQLWINDQFTHGFASFSAQHQTEWENMAARMVDAQAPGLARMIRQSLSLMLSGSEHQQEAIEQLGLIQLLVQVVLRHQQLSIQQKADIQMALGWSQEKEDIQANSTPITDNWTVLGQIIEDIDGKLTERRTWLYGQQSQQYALILDFAYKGQGGLTWNWATQRTYKATLAYYSGTYPLRAIMLTQEELDTPPQMPPHTLQENFNHATQLLSRNPWLIQTPVYIPFARLFSYKEQWWIKTSEGCFQLHMNEPNCWNLMAFSIGGDIHLFAEWDGKKFTPISAQHAKDHKKFWNHSSPNSTL